MILTIFSLFQGQSLSAEIDLENLGIKVIIEATQREEKQTVGRTPENPKMKE